ncbi:MAG: hypothetical protein IK002_10815 [Treponema sp.]|uniref:hypothetical protein n=1 Tax=Treponema sp. TaxID=166 RepID=UPI00298EAE1F|nr:hypothetical protein [Treponema sp.]MBR5934464.1 hypothetical protein [Treponema sp.]
MIINSFVYYIFFGSAVLLYGIGFNRESVMCNYPKQILFCSIKSYISVVITFLITFFLNSNFFIPLKIVEIYPFIALLIYITISVFLEILIQVTTKRTSAEFAVSFLTVILALNEGVLLIDGVLICISVLTCFYILIPVLFALEKRMQATNSNGLFKQKSLIFLCMVVIMIALYSFNISWLNSGVIK